MNKIETLATDINDILRTQMSVKGEDSARLTLAALYAVQVEAVVRMLADGDHRPQHIVHSMLTQMMEMICEASDMSADDAEEALRVAGNLLNRLKSI